MNGKQDLLLINAEEVRQFLYCQRIIYWRRIGGFRGSNTYLMNKGIEYHEQRRRSTYKRKGDLKNIRDRYFVHDELNIAGKIDLLRVREDEIIPVETKRFHNDQIRPSFGHIAQVVTGGLAASFELDKEFYEIEIRYWRGVKSTVEVTDKMKKDVLGIIDDMRSMILDKLLPAPTNHEKKCINCEYKKICHRI